VDGVRVRLQLASLLQGHLHGRDGDKCLIRV
jgi:hypothetical protein